MAREWRVEIDAKNPDLKGWLTATFPRKADAVRFAARFVDLRCTVEMVSPSFTRVTLVQGILTTEVHPISRLPQGISEPKDIPDLFSNAAEYRVQATIARCEQEAKIEVACRGNTGKGDVECCPRAGEYNGFASGPTSFACPIRCTCHD